MSDDQIKLDSPIYKELTSLNDKIYSSGADHEFNVEFKLVMNPYDADIFIRHVRDACDPNDTLQDAINRYVEKAVYAYGSVDSSADDD